MVVGIRSLLLGTWLRKGLRGVTITLSVRFTIRRLPKKYEVANLAKQLVEKGAYRKCPGLASKTLVFVRCGKFRTLYI